MDIEIGLKRMLDVQKRFSKTATEGYHDKEQMHIELDQILLDLVPQAIREIYNKIEQEEGGFWYA